MRGRCGAIVGGGTKDSCKVGSWARDGPGRRGGTGRGAEGRSGGPGLWRRGVVVVVGRLRREGGQFDVVCRGEAKLAIDADQSPVGVRGIIDGEGGIFGEGDLFVGLAGVVVESFGEMGGFCILDVVVWNEALGLVIIVTKGLFLCLPPIILCAFFQDVQKLSLLNVELAGALGLVCVEGGAYCDEAHCGEGQAE